MGEENCFQRLNTELDIFCSVSRGLPSLASLFGLGCLIEYQPSFDSESYTGWSGNLKMVMGERSVPVRSVEGTSESPSWTILILHMDNYHKREQMMSRKIIHFPSWLSLSFEISVCEYISVITKI